MSLDKSIQSGKEKRKKYRGSKAWDCSCRNGGSCSYCEGTRTHNTKRRKAESEYECELCYDTECVCGGIGLTCHGCCSCVSEKIESRNMARQNKEVEIEVVKDGCVSIKVKGYGTYGQEDGAILELDRDDDGDLRLMIWADANDESPTNIIWLELSNTANPPTS